MRGHELHRVLAVLRGVADVVFLGSDDSREAGAQCIDDRGRVVHRQRGLGHVGELLGIGDLKPGDVRRGLDEVDAAVDLAHRAFDLGVALVTDHDDFLALVAHARHFHVDLGHQRAGGVENAQAAALGLFAHGERDAMSREDHGVSGGNLFEFVDEDRSLVAQVVHHELVVHDLVAHVDRRAIALQGALDDLDRALDAGAEATRIGEQDLLVVHLSSLWGVAGGVQEIPITSTSKRMALPASGWLKSISADCASISRTRPE
jgi:hypothetical protein